MSQAAKVREDLELTTTCERVREVRGSVRQILDDERVFSRVLEDVPAHGFQIVLRRPGRVFLVEGPRYPSTYITVEGHPDDGSRLLDIYSRISAAVHDLVSAEEKVADAEEETEAQGAG